MTLCKIGGLVKFVSSVKINIWFIVDLNSREWSTVIPCGLAIQSNV